MARVLQQLFGISVVLATASPLFRDANDDSYPLSTYPMFARTLRQPRLVWAEGLARDGRATRLPPEMVANDEPMQAMRTLKLTAASGPRSLKRLCSAIAERVAGSGRFADVERVRIVEGRFNPLSYFEGDSAPTDARRLAQCRVAP